MKKADDYHIHEALDRTSVLIDMVERTLFDHPGIHKQEWQGKLEEAHQALFDLYQMIGAEHLK